MVHSLFVLAIVENSYFPPFAILRFLGKVLLVERASKPTEHNKPQQTGVKLGKDFSQSASSLKDANSTIDPSLGSRLGSIPSSEPIAPRLGVDYPFPSHLEYAYPPPDGNILTNIVNALIAVPRLYTQVLHLMNKMNIPAPFRMALPTPPLPPPVPALQSPPPPPASSPAKPHLEDASSSESEMDDKGAPRSARKHARREATVDPAIDRSVAHEAVGVKPATLIPKEIPLIKKKNPFLQIKIALKQIPNEQKHADPDDDYKQISEEPNEEGIDAKQFATADELEKGKLPPEEILSLPMFKELDLISADCF
ncbi:neutral alpha-glucosidase AB-like [Hibiscus syriacus]|uniref:Neutral alpha-glucosidase AB-like n=1 Tax=Hibiscus syriacus TaxID=106335 RepID=A0A6A2YXP9_HIBSY|nr:neutral alpha-glucosidase AB-like [Hibiscus syriacus]